MPPVARPIAPCPRFLRLGACVCTLLMILAAAGCSRRDSATVQIDVSKSLAISSKARTPANGPAVSLSALTLAAAFDGVLQRTIDAEDFRALPISARFAKDDNAKHTRLFRALAGMCSCSVRADPAAVRVTVTASDQKEAAAIANVIGRVMRNEATKGATTDLVSRREVEHRALTHLDDQAADLQLRLDRLRADAQAAASDPAPTDSRTPGPSELWASHEILTRELRRVRAEAESLRSDVRSFDDLANAVDDSASFWVVPPSAQADAGWTPVHRPDSEVAVLACTDPSSGGDWLTSSLSVTDRTLAAAVGEPDIATTTWMKSFSLPEKTSPGPSPSTRANAAAVNDLAHKVTLSPIGNGSIVALGLTGVVSPDDRTSILEALTRCILAKKRSDINVDSVHRREPLDRRIAALDDEFRDLERSFQSLAKRTGATGETIGSLYESSQEGRDIERISNSRDALDKERKSIEFRCHAVFDDVYLIRQAERLE